MTAPDPQPPAGPRTGLRAPRGLLAWLERPTPRRASRLALQLLGFAFGIALLWWCVRVAFRDESRDQLARLLHAPPLPGAGLFLLAAISVVINGVAFWGTALPVRRLRLIDTVAVNAVASFLAFLPFKLGAIARVAIHRRRDGMPLRDVIAWLAAFAALSLATLIPMFLALLVTRRVSLAWAALALAGSTAGIAAGVALGRLSAGAPWLARLSLGSWRIVRSPAPGAICAGAKLADVFVQAWRFSLAATIFGAAMPAHQAVACGILYYVLGSASPAGMLGVREAGVVLLGLGGDRETLARLVLTLSATEAATFAVLAAASGAWLLRKPRRSASVTPSPA